MAAHNATAWRFRFANRVERVWVPHVSILRHGFARHEPGHSHKPRREQPAHVLHGFAPVFFNDSAVLRSFAAAAASPCLSYASASKR